MVVAILLHKPPESEPGGNLLIPGGRAVMNAVDHLYIRNLVLGHGNWLLEEIRELSVRRGSGVHVKRSVIIGRRDGVEGCLECLAKRKSR